MLGERGMKMWNLSLEGQYLETSWIVKAGDGNAMFMDLGGRRPQRLLTVLQCTAHPATGKNGTIHGQGGETGYLELIENCSLETASCPVEKPEREAMDSCPVEWWCIVHGYYQASREMF